MHWTWTLVLYVIALLHVIRTWDQVAEWLSAVGAQGGQILGPAEVMEQVVLAWRLRALHDRAKVRCPFLPSMQLQGSTLKSSTG